MDCSPPGSSVHGIFQARILEWLAISFSRGSSWSRDRTQVSRIEGRLFTIWATRNLQKGLIQPYFTHPIILCTLKSLSDMNFGRQRTQISVPRAPEGTDFLSLFKHCSYSLEANAIQMFLIIFFSILQNLTYPLHSLLCFTVLRLNRKDEGFYKRKLWAREQETWVNILDSYRYSTATQGGISISILVSL